MIYIPEKTTQYQDYFLRALKNQTAQMTYYLLRSSYELVLHSRNHLFV